MTKLKLTVASIFAITCIANASAGLKLSKSDVPLPDFLTAFNTHFQLNNPISVPVRADAELSDLSISVDINATGFSDAILQISEQTGLGINFGNLSYLTLTKNSPSSIWHKQMAGGQLFLVKMEEQCQLSFLSYCSEGDEGHFSRKSSISEISVNGNEIGKSGYPVTFANRYGTISKVAGLLQSQSFACPERIKTIESMLTLVDEKNADPIESKTVIGSAQANGFSIKISQGDLKNNKITLNVTIKPTTEISVESKLTAVVEINRPDKEGRYKDFCFFPDMVQKDGVYESSKTVHLDPDTWEGRTLRIRIIESSVRTYPIDVSIQ